jgi:hypothetical protein
MPIRDVELDAAGRDVELTLDIGKMKLRTIR